MIPEFDPTIPQESTGCYARESSIGLSERTKLKPNTKVTTYASERQSVRVRNADFFEFPFRRSPRTHRNLLSTIHAWPTLVPQRRPGLETIRLTEQPLLRIWNRDSANRRPVTSTATR